MIYILCIKWGKVRASVPAVGNVELTMQGDELTSSEVAKRRGMHGS
jgi:hypothetical protein